MPIRIQHRPQFLAAVALLIVPAATFARNPESLSGSLNIEQGVRVLRLDGDARQRGYAHGYLLAEEIRQMVTTLLVSPQVRGDVQRYELGVRRQAIPQFTFTAAEQRELEGMLEGLSAKLGADGMRIATVGRSIDLVDLKALNVFADLQNGGCTSFAAWGPATPDGGMIVGRNLDFDRLPGLGESQLLVVRPAAGDKLYGWVSVNWPGQLGGYTAMNDAGVFAAMHDVMRPTNLVGGPFVPRALAIRRIMETVDATDTVTKTERLLQGARAFCGNNFMVAAPFHGQATPAAVFEYDADTSRSAGVTVRTPSARDHRLPEHTLACTNHYRARGQSFPCKRYASVRRVLKENASGGLDTEQARAVQQSAAVHDTLHTVIAQPNQRTFWVSFCTPEQDATGQPPAKFLIDALLASRQKTNSTNE